ncbi:MAG: CDP-alcohol phosphatidyltransferase family protein [Promethearchaeota archaeon]
MKLKPNHATFIMLVFSILSSISLCIFKSFLVFSIFIFMVMIFDGVDGTLARISNQTTTFGGFFDSTLDRISEFIIFTSLYFIGVVNFIFNSDLFHFLIILISISSFMTSYLRSKGETLSNKRGDFDIGLFARSERLFLIFIITIFPNPHLFSWGVIFLSIGTLGTALFRFFKFSKFLKNNITNKIEKI